MKQTTEISIELTETVAYRLRDARAGTVCPHCGSLTPREAPGAAILTRTTEREVYRSLETFEIDRRKS